MAVLRCGLAWRANQAHRGPASRPGPAQPSPARRNGAWLIITLKPRLLSDVLPVTPLLPLLLLLLHHHAEHASVMCLANGAAQISV